MLFLLVAICVLVFSLWYIFLREPDWAKRFPGNCGWPIIGCVLEMDPRHPHLTLTKWAQTYGGTMKVCILGQYHLVLSNYAAIYEALVLKSSDFAGRTSSFREYYISRQHQSLANHHFSPRFINFKKFLMKGMRTSHLGQQNLEKSIRVDMEELVSKLKSARGQPIDMREDLRLTILNFILTTSIGMRLEKSDKRVEEINQLERLTIQGMALNIEGILLDLLPWTRYFGGQLFTKLQECMAIKTTTIDDLALTAVNRSAKYKQFAIILDPLIDAVTNSTSDLKQLHVCTVTSDLIIAGLTTTSSLIYLLINLFLHYPDIQQKAQQEVDKAATGQTITLEDRPHMPYIQATILEALRYFSNAPLSIPHSTTCQTELGGVSLPAGVPVIFNLWALHHDELFWKDPFTFNPERFLEEGKLLGPEHPNRKRLLPFGAGRRMCLGDNMALLRIFLIVSNLLQNFTFMPPDGTELVSCDPRNEGFQYGVVPHPPDFLVRPIPRK